MDRENDDPDICDRVSAMVVGLSLGPNHMTHVAIHVKMSCVARFLLSGRISRLSERLHMQVHALYVLLARCETTSVAVPGRGRAIAGRLLGLQMLGRRGVLFFGECFLSTRPLQWFAGMWHVSDRHRETLGTLDMACPQQVEIVDMAIQSVATLGLLASRVFPRRGESKLRVRRVAAGRQPVAYLGCELAAEGILSERYASC